MAYYPNDACTLTEDLLVGCAPLSVGGIDSFVYLIDRRSVEATDFNADGSVANITFKTDFIKALKIEFAETTGTATQALQGDKATSKNWLQTVGFTIKSMSQDIANKIDQLILTQGAYFIVPSFILNGAVSPINEENRYFMFGLTKPLTNATGESGFGAAETDLVGTTLTFTNAQTKLAPEIVPDPAIYTSNNPMREFLEAIAENPSVV